MARCADTSENGTPCSPSRATTRPAGSPEMVSVSRSVAAMVAPACASTVVASSRAVVRSAIRSPDAAASSAATLVSAMT